MPLPDDFPQARLVLVVAAALALTCDRQDAVRRS
jgi:hypothetical protein